MMRLILFTLLILSWNAFGQRSYVPVVSLNYGQFLSNDLRTREFQLGSGLELNKYFSVQLTFRNMKDLREYTVNGISTNNAKKLEIYCLSLEPLYKVLKDKMISPVLGMNIGISLYSNGKGKFLNQNFSIQPKFNGSSYSIYERGLFFGKIKTLLDFRLYNFDFLVGGNYSINAFKVTAINPILYEAYKEVGDQFIHYERGFGFEVSLMYTFGKGNQSKSEP